MAADDAQGLSNRRRNNSTWIPGTVLVLVVVVLLILLVVAAVGVVGSRDGCDIDITINLIILVM
jgi:uncharacterized metal-binding protein